MSSEDDEGGRTARFRVGLHALILISFTVVFAVMTAVLAWLSWKERHRLVDETLTQLHEQVALRIERRLAALLDVPVNLLEPLAEQARLGLLPVEDRERLLQRFVSQLRAHSHLSNLSLATPDGHYVNAYRDWLRPDAVMVSLAEPGGPMRSHHVDEAGRRIGELEPLEGFDVTARPWYRAALEARAPTWYGPYRFFSGGSLAVGMAWPVYREPDGLAGVLAADISLHDFSRFLAAIDLAPGGAAFVVDDEGLLLADDSGRPPLTGDDDSSRRLAAAESPSAAIRFAARHLPSDVPAGTGSARRIESGDEVWFLAWQRISREAGPGMTIGVSVPRPAYLDAMVTRDRQAVLIAIGTLVLFLAAAWALAHAISRPIRDLAEASTRVGEDPATDFPRSRVREIDRLAHSFRDMAGRLETTMASLERRVTERTALLQAANVRLDRISRTDSLTGLANRRDAHATMVREWRRARRSGRPLALVLADIDWFKDYNDRYGHPAGDRALVRVAETLAACTRRAGDVVARYGGEEFLFILPGLDSDDARAFAEHVREAIEALAIEHDGSPLGRMTMSFGVTASVATREAAGSDGVEGLLRTADRALYAAKRSGRNRVATREHDAGDPGPDPALC